MAGQCPAYNCRTFSFDDGFCKAETGGVCNLLPGKLMDKYGTFSIVE